MSRHRGGVKSTAQNWRSTQPLSNILHRMAERVLHERVMPPVKKKAKYVHKLTDEQVRQLRAEYEQAAAQRGGKTELLRRWAEETGAHHSYLNMVATGYLRGDVKS